MEVKCKVTFTEGREPKYETVLIDDYSDQLEIQDYLEEELYDYLSEEEIEIDDIQFVEFIDFPDVVEGMCDDTHIPDVVFEFAHLSSYKEQDIVEAYWADYNQDVTDIQSILESYVCDLDDWDDYAKAFANDLIASVTDPRVAEMFERYFDYGKFISDMEYDYYFCGDYVFNA